MVKKAGCSVTSSEALRHIRGYAAAGRVQFSRHAYQRMDERGSSARDVITALANAVHCVPASGTDCWKAVGPDLDDDELSVVVAIEDGLVVVTLF
jgi:hypothetical protein